MQYQFVKDTKVIVYNELGRYLELFTEREGIENEMDMAE